MFIHFLMSLQPLQKDHRKGGLPWARKGGSRKGAEGFSGEGYAGHHRLRHRHHGDDNNGRHNGDRNVDCSYLRDPEEDGIHDVTSSVS